MKVDQEDSRALLTAIDAETELKNIRQKYDDLSRRMDDILAQTMERSNRILMETEISNLIMSQVFNASNDGIWAVDRNYRVIRVNKRLLDFLGLPAKDVVGSYCHDLLSGMCRNESECPMERIRGGEPMVEQEKCLAPGSGKPIPFLVTSTPLSGLDQGIIGLVETFSDITERKHAERRLLEANKELERLATEDGLTKLSNRRHFDRCLKLEWRRQARARNSIALVMCDVDLFKNYNDHYGHQAGDACLQKVAYVIRSQARRASDLIARYGGEEFALILPGTDLQGARLTAEAICYELLKIRIANRYSTVVPFVTISCGVACMSPSGENRPQTLIERADQALYRAKQEGRNRVVVYDSVESSPTSALRAFDINPESPAIDDTQSPSTQANR